ncbi:hypothetical protein [Evtepia sp.]|uniref:hypothetical protein n=1 Tax=Evtepia sp. TaxID=2773933 RepID=UPI002840158C|nr:hypothetical protein [Evtepia sp.]
MPKTMEMKHSMNEQQKQAVIEQLWLTYYNDTLFAQALITEAQYNKMRLLIKNRTAAK